jgi:hypothetical protein
MNALLIEPTLGLTFLLPTFTTKLAWAILALCLSASSEPDYQRRDCGETEGNLPAQVQRLLRLEITQSGSVRLLWGTDVPGTDAFSGLARKGRDTSISSAERSLTIHWPGGHTAFGYHQQYAPGPYQEDQ